MLAVVDFSPIRQMQHLILLTAINGMFYGWVTAEWVLMLMIGDASSFIKIQQHLQKVDYTQ